MTDWLATNLRKSCDQCGSTRLDWMTAGELSKTLTGRSAQMVRDAVAFFGRAAEAWKCSRCGNCGVFGPTHFDFA